MLFYAQKMPKNDLFAHASQYCTARRPGGRPHHALRPTSENHHRLPPLQRLAADGAVASASPMHRVPCTVVRRSRHSVLFRRRPHNLQQKHLQHVRCLSGWGSLGRRIESALVNKYRSIVKAPGSPSPTTEAQPVAGPESKADKLARAVQEAITIAQSDDSETKWLKMAAKAGNTKATERLLKRMTEQQQQSSNGSADGPRKASESGTSSPLGGRGKAAAAALEDEYFHRAELELLQRLRAQAAAAEEEEKKDIPAVTTQQQQLAHGGAALPRKASKSGAMSFEARGQALENDWVRRQEAGAMLPCRRRRRRRRRPSARTQTAPPAHSH
eukprot:COSAG01_NODE_3295_length_6298_cov_4.734473_1_plen_329_part_00